MARANVCVLCIVTIVASLFAVAAYANDAATQRVDDHVRSGRLDAARTLLIDIVESNDVDPTSLAHAAMWALRLEDVDLLGRVRAAGERIETDRGVSDPMLDFALGVAYAGLAEQHLKARTGGSSVGGAACH